MMRITAYADRLLADLDLLDWPETIKLMQRNWIGRSTGALARFAVDGHAGVDIEVFTTRPDTLFGATYMVLAPEHPLLDAIVAGQLAGGHGRRVEGDVRSRRGSGRGRHGATGNSLASKSELERQAEGREKTGVFTGAFAINPTNRELIPVFVADYVLMGYGTGAIMAVPAHDQRDFEFAREFELPIVGVIRPGDECCRSEACGGRRGRVAEAYVGDGVAMSSANDEVSLDGQRGRRREARDRRVAGGRRSRPGPTVTYKLRDWLFSRQRYWGEPFPIVYDEDGPIALPESMLPVELPEIDELRAGHVRRSRRLPTPRRSAAAGSRSSRLRCSVGAGPGRRARSRTAARRTRCRSGPGSCWYYLRYLDPNNEDRLVDPAVERSGRGRRGDGSPKAGLVDLYVGGVEHAVLHLLYARFWHKVLYDLGHVSTVGAVPASGEPGHDPGRRPTPTRAASTSRRRGVESATARSCSRASRSPASSARWARA